MMNMKLRWIAMAVNYRSEPLTKNVMVEIMNVNSPDFEESSKTKKEVFDLAQKWAKDQNSQTFEEDTGFFYLPINFCIHDSSLYWYPAAAFAEPETKIEANTWKIIKERCTYRVVL